MKPREYSDDGSNFRWNSGRFFAMGGWWIEVNYRVTRLFVERACKRNQPSIFLNNTGCHDWYYVAILISRHCSGSYPAHQSMKSAFSSSSQNNLLVHFPNHSSHLALASKSLQTAINHLHAPNNLLILHSAANDLDRDRRSLHRLTVLVPEFVDVTLAFPFAGCRDGGGPVLRTDGGYGNRAARVVEDVEDSLHK